MILYQAGMSLTQLDDYIASNEFDVSIQDRSNHSVGDVLLCYNFVSAAHV